MVGPVFGTRRRHVSESSLDELTAQDRPKPDPAIFLGRGNAETLATACDKAEVEQVIFDDELSPGQLLNFEEAQGS